jgi:HrpA-like RNA helicase
MVKEFQKILSLFLDFLQKEKFAKLRKLRESQANLPIAEFRDEILDKVAQNRVVIVAGDTGCGKSTQVTVNLSMCNFLTSPLIDS